MLFKAIFSSTANNKIEEDEKEEREREKEKEKEKKRKRSKDQKKEKEKRLLILFMSYFTDPLDFSASMTMGLSVIIDIIMSVNSVLRSYVEITRDFAAKTDTTEDFISLSTRKVSQKFLKS